MTEGHETGSGGTEEAAWDEGLKEVFGAEDRSVLERIEEHTGWRSRVLLRDLDDEASPVVRLRCEEDAETARDDRRYQIAGEIARGGVGVILKARDRDLGRDVALKVLRADLVDHPEIVQRFVEEAQIEGQLTHPGIVPVHDLGLRPDGRPYFAMKLVKGKTLAALLKERESPAHDRRRFLTIFEKVCDTIAYAHARGVIHRDLKPSNVLVGSYGEVQVVDWGFAKVRPQGGIADEAPTPPPAPDVTVVETVRTREGSTQSLVGSVMGTPAYMPPEQARGEVSRLDERSDVFSLGAVLCEILSGKPPYVGERSRLLAMAADADLGDATARLDACGADEELVALTRRCLSPATSARPRDAGELATAIHDHLAALDDRVRKAELRAAAAQRTRRLTIALAATVLVAVVGAAVGLHVTDRNRRERASRAAAAVSETLEEATLLLGRARETSIEDLSRWPAVVDAAERAEALARRTEGGESTHARTLAFLARVREESASAHRAAETARRDREWAERLEDLRLRRGEDFDEAEKLAAYASVFEEIGLDANRIRASAHADAMVAALDDWCACESNRALESILRAVDTDPWRAEIRRLAREDDADGLLALRKEEDRASRPLPSLLILADALGRAGHVTDAVGVLRDAQRSHGGSFRANVDLGWWLTRLPDPAWSEAAGHLSVASSLRPESQPVRYVLGHALWKMGDTDGAIATFREVHAQEPGLGKFRDRFSTLLAARAAAYQQQRMFAAAARLCEEVVEVRPDWHPGWMGLTCAYEALGRKREALEAARKAAEIPPEDRLRIGNVGICAYKAGEYDEAIRAWKRHIELEPTGAAYGFLGSALCQVGRYDEAMAAYQEGLRITRQPVNWCLLVRMIGDIHRRKGRFTEAVSAYRAVLRVTPRSWHANGGLAYSLRRLGREDEARQAQEEHIRTELKAAALQTEDLVTHNNLGFLMAFAYERQEALRIHREALPTVAPAQFAEFLCRYGNARRSLWGEEEVARLCYEEALERCPGHAGARLGLARLEWRRGDPDAAGRTLESALADVPQDWKLNVEYAFVLFELGRTERALSHWKKSGAKCTCESCGRLDREWERMVELDREFPAILEREESLTGTTDRIALARVCAFRKRPAAAARLIAAAIRDGADELEKQWGPARHSYHLRIWAAGLAVRAAAGEGLETRDAARRAEMRALALTLLRQRLEALMILAHTVGENVRTNVGAPVYRLRADDRFESVRGPALAVLPEAERRLWEGFWAEAEAFWKLVR